MKHAPCRRHVLNVNFPGRHWPLLSPPSYGCLANNRSFTADSCQPPPTAVGHASPPSNGCLANNRSFNRWPPPAAANRRRPLTSTIQRSFIYPASALSPLTAASRRPPSATRVHHPTAVEPTTALLTAGRRQSPPTAVGHSNPPSNGCLVNRRSFHRWPPPAAADQPSAAASRHRQPLPDPPTHQPTGKPAAD